MKLRSQSPLLEFNDNQEELTSSLSTALIVEEKLWVASDELTSVERLTLVDGEVFRDHRSFELQGIINLPAHGKTKPDGKKIDQEIDIEGMDHRDGFLWLAGSHSIKRKKVDDDDRDDDDQKNINKLSKTENQGNRFLLARIPLVKNEQSGEAEPRATSENGTLRAAQLPGTMADNFLTRAIAGEGAQEFDPHLFPFLSIPGKDNGFDVEGLAVTDDKVFLGLRGPVLRGWAIILELEIEAGNSAELTLKRIGPKGRPYRKHFLDLRGLGVRDLCLDGSDLLILAGPTMNLDGPVRILRWKDGAVRDQETVVWNDELKDHMLEVPSGEGSDHAEGMTLIPEFDPSSVLIVYDSPGEKRRVGKGAVRADIFQLP